MASAGAQRQEHKILPACTLALADLGVVDRIITELAVMDVTSEGLRVIELAPGVDEEELRQKTGCRLQMQ